MGAIQLSAGVLPSDKVQTRHRDRQAVVYVRQSTMHQVQRNQESTRLQYALTEAELDQVRRGQTGPPSTPDR